MQKNPIETPIRRRADNPTADTRSVKAAFAPGQQESKAPCGRSTSPPGRLSETACPPGLRLSAAPSSAQPAGRNGLDTGRPPRPYTPGSAEKEAVIPYLISLPDREMATGNLLYTVCQKSGRGAEEDGHPAKKLRQMLPASRPDDRDGAASNSRLFAASAAGRGLRSKNARQKSGRRAGR